MPKKNKKIIVAIVGKSASGKDSVAKRLNHRFERNGIDCGLIVSDTTRPMRSCDVDGVDYNFISQMEFTKKYNCGEYLESTIFNGWNYGTPKDLLFDVNIGVFSPSGIESLKKKSDNGDFNILVVYLKCPLYKRLFRSIKREHRVRFEFLRRASTDYIDFKDIEDSIKSFDNNLIVDSSEDSIDDIVYLINNFMAFRRMIGIWNI